MPSYAVPLARGFSRVARRACARARRGRRTPPRPDRAFASLAAHRPQEGTTYADAGSGDAASRDGPDAHRSRRAQATGRFVPAMAWSSSTGSYCPDVEQRCLEWMDPPGTPYEHFRCKRYAQPAVCHGKRVHKRFCIDATERTEGRRGDLPRNHMSWGPRPARLCESDGARLCKASEWQFACEGEELRPYPYGWERDATTCNVDVMTGLGKVGQLVDHRTPASAHPRCVSPFGVHDMAGNVDEWATVDGLPKGEREVMKGSWWLPGRHACRSGQGGHGAWYGGTESGARCCADALSEATGARGERVPLTRVFRRLSSRTSPRSRAPAPRTPRGGSARTPATCRATSYRTRGRRTVCRRGDRPRAGTSPR